MAGTFVDRGDSYRVQYLGSAMLSQMATGLGVLQKPLRNLYVQFRQDNARSRVQLQERTLMMTNRGMVMSSPGNEAGHPDIHAMPSILFWDAVQFVVVKGHDKKLRAAFEPLDNDHSRNKDNLFSPLDKQLSFLQGQRHPPLFTCVLRRSQGLKALDAHAFVCNSDEEALGLVRALNTVHRNYTSGEQQETGVFGYNPFGNESVRSTAGLQRELNQRQAAAVSGNGGHRQSDTDQFILQQPGNTAQDPVAHANNVPSRSSASVRDKHSRTKSPARGSRKDYSRFTGSQPNLFAASQLSAPAPTQAVPSQAPRQEDYGSGDRNSRVFLLSQSDFQLNKPRAEDTPASEVTSSSTLDHPPRRQHSTSISKPLSAAKSNPLPTGGGTYEYLQHIDKTLERPRDQGSRGQVQEANQAISVASAVTASNAAIKKSASTRSAKPPHYGSVERAASVSNPTPKPLIEFSTGGIFQEDPGSLRSKTGGMGQGYGLLSSSQGPPPGYAPLQNSRQPYAPSPTSHIDERSSSPTYQHTIPRNKDKPQISPPAPTPTNLNRNPSTAQAYENISRFVDNHRGSSSGQDRQGARPSGYPAPVVASHSTAMLGKSDSFRQSDRTSPERRPASTTQGMVMAQVTPQDQRGAGPFASRQSPGLSVWDKHSVGSSPNLKTSETAFSSQQSTHSKPVAMVPPHKIQGVRVLPTQPSLTRRDTNPKSSSHAGPTSSVQDAKSPDNPFGNRTKSMSPSEDSSLRMTQSQYLYDPKGYSVPEKTAPSGEVYALPRKASQKSKQKHSQPKNKTETPSNWQFHRSPAKPEMDGRGTSQNSEKKQTEPLLVNQKKDAEIASVLQNIHFDYEGTLSPHAPHRTNFEKSLGYFP